MASIPCTVQLSTGTTTTKNSRRAAAQGQERGGGGPSTPLLVASDGVHTMSSQMLHSDGVLLDRIPSSGKAKKKGNLYGVEAMDVNVKLRNAMSSRFKKLGFPKLSEMFA